MPHRKTALASSGALLREIHRKAEETLPEPILHIVLPLPPEGVLIAPPATMRDSSYEWLRRFHAVCRERLSRFTLQNGQQVVLVEARWVNTRDGREQYSSTDALYGHSTHTLGASLDGSSAIHRRDPTDWTVAWFDLQQGKGRSMGIQELRWNDFAGGNTEAALRKLERVSSHIKGFAVEEHRTVMFTFQPMGN